MYLLRINKKMKTQVKKLKSFWISSGISSFTKRKRNRKERKRSKKKKRYSFTKALALTTIYATTKDSSVFTARTDFGLGTIFAVIDNCATATVINDKALFPYGLQKATGISIVTVSGDNYRLTYIGTAAISFKDDKNKIHRILIPNTLYFQSSPVNVVSVG